MDNVTAGGIAVTLIGVLKGKDFWAWLKDFNKHKADSSKASAETEEKLQDKITSLYDKKIEMMQETATSMKTRMKRIEAEREEYYKRMIKAEAKVDALTERLGRYIHHSRGKKKIDGEE